MRLPGVEFDAIGPQRIFHYYDAAAGLRAVVVIDTARFGISAGGVRMASDLTLAEMARLARAMSCKFAMLGLPCGGAKSGIWLDPSDPCRPRVLRAFLDAIAPLVENRTYMPGADMGTSAADFAGISESAGRTSLGQQEFEGMPLEDQLTGYGVVMAARAAAEWLGWPLPGSSVAIEGFGKVGAGAAKYFAREGARIVAVSTVRGTLFRPQGLDVERMLALRAAHGDAALERYGAGQPLLPREALLTVAADVLVPGARPDAIHSGNAGAIAARLVVPAANIPYAAATPGQLHARGIVPLPDFVTNAGGVLASLVELQGGAAEDAFRTVREQVTRNVCLVLADARDQQRSAYDAGVAIAYRRINGEW